MGEVETTVKLKVLSSMGIRDIENPEEAFETVVTALGAASKVLNCDSLAAFIDKVDFAPIKSLKQLTKSELGLVHGIVKMKEDSLTHSDIINNQIGVQKLIDPFVRKRIAAYYTKANGLELMAQTAMDFIRTKRNQIVLADPFLGSGLTITETLKRIDSSRVRMVWGIEPHPLAALVAYCSILYFLNGDRSKVKVCLGDTFQKVYDGPRGSAHELASPEERGTITADIILTNPPFTRWELQEKSHRLFLRELIANLGYSKYLRRKQLNLQLVSLFIIDHLLRRRGLLVSVLPASTFYTLYGVAAKAMLEEKYQIRAFVECESDNSFSIDSGLKEVVLIATKNETDHHGETAFITLESGDTKRIQLINNIVGGARLCDENINWIDLTKKSLVSESNWSIFFGKTKLREILTQILSQASKEGTIGSWGTLYGKDSIMRGVEMYGPDFFFVPNNYWIVAEEHPQSVTIKNNQRQTVLKIPRDYLVPALRKPAVHVAKIKPSVSHYLLSIPPEPATRLDGDIARYMHWSKLDQTAQPAIQAFGKVWYSHVHKQIRIKKPYGRVFLPDKIDPTFRNRGFFASYSRIPLVASKNFHIATLNDESKDKILAAWLNSTIFAAYFMIAGRKITRTWSRLLEDDYLRTPTINVDGLHKHAATEVARAFEVISEMELPPMKLQLGSNYRRRIDRNLLKAMGVDKPDSSLSQLYSALEPNLS
jgi:hypothetical protein